MSWLTDRAYRARAEQALEPGETLLFLEHVYRTALPSPLDLERAARGDTRPHPWRQRWILGFDLPGGLNVNIARQGYALVGSSGHGGPGTVGNVLWHLLDEPPLDPPGPDVPPPPGRSLLLAVTPSRLLLLASPAPREEGPPPVVLAVARSLVTGARRSRRPFAGRGVVEISFADGSMKAVQLALWTAGRARRLVRLLGG